MRSRNGLIAVMASNVKNQKLVNKRISYQMATTTKQLDVANDRGCNSVVECLLRMQKVLGSNPSSSIFFITSYFVRVLPCVCF